MEHLQPASARAKQSRGTVGQGMNGKRYPFIGESFRKRYGLRVPVQISIWPPPIRPR